MLIDFITNLLSLRYEAAINYLVVIDRLIKGVIIVAIKSIIVDTLIDIFLLYYYIYSRLLITIAYNL